MEYVNAALMIIGFFIIGYYQRQKIGALEKQLNSQKEILGNTKTFIDLFDLKKLEGYGDIVEKKVRMEMEGQITQIKNQIGGERKKFKESFSILSDEMSTIIETLIDALLYLPTTRRVKIVNDMKGMLKGPFLHAVDKINQSEAEAKGNALRALLAEGLSVSEEARVEISKPSGSV